MTATAIASPPLTPTGHIRQAVETLAACRRVAADAGKVAAELMGKFAAENAQALGAARVAKLAVEQSEAQVKALSLAFYNSIPDTDVSGREAAKKPAPGVVIKMGESLKYEAAAALAWARETKLALVPESLDVAAFEKIADATPLPFVTKVPTPKPTIATDLDKAIALVEVSA